MNNYCQLHELPLGRLAKIVAVELPPAEGQRLMEMGFVPGTCIRIIRRAPLGDPLQVEIRNSHFSLRTNTAKSIKVQVLQ